MSISEANAVNDIARELIRLAACGTAVGNVLEHGTSVLLLNANKTLSAGHTAHSFLADLAVARRQAARPAEASR